MVWRRVPSRKPAVILTPQFCARVYRTPVWLRSFPATPSRFAAHSTAELFTKCCPRKLETLEMDPNREALVGTDGRQDTVGAFAKSELVNALRGHPGCVQDLCRLVHEERSLFLHKERLLKVDVPKVGETPHVGIGRWHAVDICCATSVVVLVCVLLRVAD